MRIFFFDLVSFLFETDVVILKSIVYELRFYMPHKSRKEKNKRGKGDGILQSHKNVSFLFIVGFVRKETAEMISLDASIHESYYLFLRFFFSQESGDNNSLLLR